ncbi:uncharacterized protein LOC123037890 [Drosophila rhopaloa]|uniref:Uncharacterized protein n=1 Tax=Drosophila rhopaloa TaxID=1041015 RepID=A0ABM5JCR2_DRORH|nr:uncharacterized protein LOC123037890 [Drosophila rhopaloa]
MASMCGQWLLTIFLSVEVMCYSVQFGIMHSLSVPIYEIEIYSNKCGDNVDVEYKQQANSGFHINLILVIDESHIEWKGQASILTGGIGYNFTTLRLKYMQPDVAKVIVLIYGLPRLGLHALINSKS